MKKILTGLAVTALSVVGMSAMASAQISNTGPGSNNTINTNNTRICNSTSANNAVVTNASAQTSTSGSSNVSGNTTGGGATSGTSNNSNNTLTSIIATNSSGCVPATLAVTPPTTGGGKGADVPTEAEAVAAKGAASVAVLPDTGEVSSQVYAASTALISGLALAGIAGKDLMLRRREQ